MKSRLQFNKEKKKKIEIADEEVLHWIETDLYKLPLHLVIFFILYFLHPHLIKISSFSSYIFFFLYLTLYCLLTLILSFLCFILFFLIIVILLKPHFSFVLPYSFLIQMLLFIYTPFFFTLSPPNHIRIKKYFLQNSNHLQLSFLNI